MKKVHVLIQARIGSKRLYQKSLLKIKDKSLVEYCYYNAFFKSKEFKFSVLIPNTRKNKLLENELKSKKIQYFKGNEANVLKRFKDYLKNKNKDDDVIRLTADNPVVDKSFLKFCYHIYKNNNHQYFSSHLNLKNNPYGLSLEIFKVSKIFESFKKDKSKKNQEHVTHYIKKKYLLKRIYKYHGFNLKTKNLNLSIDTLQDYIRVRNILENNNNLYFNNLKKIKRTKKIKILNNKKSKFALGAVQLGIKYFSNKKVSQTRANNILSHSSKRNIDLIDTARDYGKSEKYIGNFLHKSKKKFIISTKLKSISLNKANKELIRDQISESILESLSNLKINYIDYLFIHNPRDIYNKTIIHELLKFKKTGLIKNLGISIYETKDLNILKKNIFEAIQLPLNIFDNRFLDFIMKNKKYLIFARSLLLRGNINKKVINLPKQNKYNFLKNSIKIFCEKKNYQDYFELTFAFLNYFKARIFKFVIGFQNYQQIKILDKYANTKPISKKNINNLIQLIQKSKIVKDIDLRNW